MIQCVATRSTDVRNMKLEEPSRDECLDLIDQATVNLDALINIIIANGDDISRQDIATLLIVIRNEIRHGNPTLTSNFNSIATSKAE